MARDKKKKDSSELVPGFSLTHQINQFQFLDRFSAQEQGVGRAVVLDIVDLSKLSREQGEDFKRASAILAEVSSHPNIVTLLRTSATVDGRPVLVFEGGFEMFEPSQSENPSERREHVIGAARRLHGAVSTAHTSGLLHGNIRPENIVVTKFGEPALANFILWTPNEGEQPLAEWSPDGFMPPEYLLGGSPSPASDQFGFATSLFALLFGSPMLVPLPGETHVDFISRLINEIPKKPAISELSSELWSVFLRATDKVPGKRFLSIDEFFDAFSRAIQPAEVDARAAWAATDTSTSDLKIVERVKDTDERLLEAAPQPKVIVIRPPRPVATTAVAVSTPVPPAPVRSATLEVGASAIALTRDAPIPPVVLEPMPEPISEPVPAQSSPVAPSVPKSPEVRAGQHCSEGHANAFGARFCTTCGSPFGGDRIAGRPDGTSVPATPKTMIKGPLAVPAQKDPVLRCACGRENGVDAVSCVSCGRALPSASSAAITTSVLRAEPKPEPAATSEERIAITQTPDYPAPPALVSEAPTPAAADTPRVPARTPPDAPKTVSCRSCSFENDAEVNFCRNCAKPLRSAGSKDDVVMIFDTTQVKD